MSERIFKTSELAAYSSVSKKTIRHYRKIGLIEPTYIDHNNYWYFDLESAEKLNFITKLKRLDFSLEAIKDFLDDDHDCQLRKLEACKRDLLTSIAVLQDSVNLVDKILALDGQNFVERLELVEQKEHEQWISAKKDDEAIQELNDVYSQEENIQDHHKIVEVFRDIKVFLNPLYEDQLCKALMTIDEVFRKHFPDRSKRQSVMKLHVDMLHEDTGMLGI